MGRPSTDYLLFGFFEFVLKDLRRNPWILTDIFADAVNDPLTRIEYGDKEPRNAIEWFLNNNIEVVMWGRRDRSLFPSISIQQISSSEMLDRTTLGDEFLTEDIDPSYANIQVDKLVQNFTPVSYDPATGILTMPDSVNTYQVAPLLHMAVESKTGKSFVIQKVLTPQQFSIIADSVIDLQDIFIAPVTAAWKVHRKRTRFRESYEVAANVVSDPVQCIWLAQVIEYVMLKYKERFLNNRNMQLSTFRCSSTSRSNNYHADNVYQRFFSLDFETEMDWIDTIAPPLAKVEGGIYISDATRTPDDLWNNSISKQEWAPIADRGRKK